jgi:HK97 family phage major capsid protein/HK97 family phage prohead protease
MEMTRRAYSFFTIKAVNEDRRIIRGIATTPSVDRVGDIVDPLGVKFQNPLAFLWQHDHTKPIGTVKFDKPTKDGITFEAEIPVVSEPGVLKDRVDEAWQSIKLGLVRAVSIGFRAIEYSFIENGGIRFAETEVYELSAVSVPAQSDAVITGLGKNMDAAAIAVIKQFDIGAPASSGHDKREVEPGRKAVSPGVSGLTKTVKIQKPGENSMAKTTAEQISAFEATRAAKAAELETIMTGSEGETLDAEAGEAADTLEGEIAAIDKHLKRLRVVESIKAAGAKAITVVEKSEDGSAQRGGHVAVRVKQKLQPGIGFARFARVKAIARLDGESPRTIARELYGEDSDVFGMVSKAAVGAATTGGQTWGSQLVGDETGVFADFVEFLRPQTILGRFGANGVPSLRRVPFRTALVGQTGGGAGYWVGEGKAKPLTSFAFTRTTLEPLKVANIAVASEEVLRDSSPSAEMIIRDSLAAALRERMDTDFINPAKSASAGVSPASITNGISPIAATGTGDADDVRADVQALFAAFIEANNAPTSGVFIMPATLALALSLMLNPLGQPEFPGINMNGGTFFGLPVIVSEYVPTITGGAYVALVNAQDIYLADDGGIAVDMSREASLEMATDPTMTADSPTEQTVVSLWQTNTVGFRAERTINWSRRRDSAVALLSGANWSAGA